MIHRIRVSSESEQQLREITDQVNEVLRRLNVGEGLCQVYAPHTTAGIILNENADPDVCSDMLSWLEAIVPQSERYQHAEGNAPAHIKSSLVGQSALIPIENGRLALGRWQGVYLAEFDGPRQRTVIVNVIGA